MAKTKKELTSSGQTSDEDALLKEQKLHVILEDRLFHETARTLISDDAQAYSQAVDPNHAKNLAFENSITYHPHGIKRKRLGGGFSKSKKDGEEATASYKVFCCCQAGSKVFPASFISLIIDSLYELIYTCNFPTLVKIIFQWLSLGSSLLFCPPLVTSPTGFTTLTRAG